MANHDRARFEQVAEQSINRLFAASPATAAFHRGEGIDREFYRRHLVETVLRIRLNNEVDAFALYKIGFKDNHLAQILAQYLAEEYGHEGLFLRDIEKFGLTDKQVDAIQPFHSTDKLIGYLYLSIGRDGPLPTMVWNWFVEWYSDRYNKIITEAAAQAFGQELVKGSLGHIQYDESRDHDDLMWGAVQRAIDGWGGIDKAEAYLRHFVGLIGEYFDELREATQAQPEAVAA
ncbi:hypothetical protein [Burkholderia gladioli]|uniref:hypothetical protein n=1 Tax=Burkholderia gladioli TaxID=28095 RepID=UPI000BF12A10|nr:hypothetical protein [Burkholderia gladioli]PEH84279.1 hypothetical protein CRM95_04445 [Burkholderia gladioli]